MARTWCGAHYARWHRHGDPNATAPSRRALDAGESKNCTRCDRSLPASQFPSGWAPCMDCRAQINYSAGRTCATCACPITNGSKTGLCREHLGESRRQAGKPRRITVAGGYIALTCQWDHPNARSRGHLLEHVKVMSEVLGRPLHGDENVHHINGDRTDNRPENLELWSTKQPQGQRVVDKVAWAREILERYGNEVHELSDVA